MIANLIEAGNIQLVDADTDKSLTVKRAIVIQFDSDSAIREAIRNRTVDFTLFEHYESTEWQAVNKMVPQLSAS